MQFTDFFIRRPILSLVVSLVIVIAGLQAIGSLNVRQYPRSQNSTVTVSTVCEMESIKKGLPSGMEGRVAYDATSLFGQG